MSFVTNVNTLAAYLGILDRAVKIFDEDALRVLKEVPADAFNLLAEDLSKGTFIGKRKIDIDLIKNSKNPPNELAYTAAEILLSSGYVVGFNFNLTTSSGGTSSGGWITESISYQNLRDELNNGIADSNAINMGDPDREIRNTYIDIVGETDPNAPKRALRILDTNDGTSNVVAITLHVNPAMGNDAVDQDPTYSWVDTTSSLLVLINHLPEFIKHTEIWQQVMSKDPLPSKGIGFLAKTATELAWQTGAFFKDLGHVDITQDMATAGIAAADIHLGSFALVGTGGKADPSWGFDKYIRTGSILLGDPDGKFRVLDDVFHARAVVDTTKNAPETQGLLGYDSKSQRLAISLPTNIPNTFAWVDASPSLSAGDLSAILAPDGSIDSGALNTQATTPKQVNAFVLTYAGKKTDVDALLSSVSDLQTKFASIPSATNLTLLQTAVGDLQTAVTALPTTYLPLTGGVMTGALVLGRTPVTDMEPVNLKYATDTFVSLTGGILTGALQYGADPVANNDLVRKSYVDNMLGSGVSGLMRASGATMTGELILPAAPPATDASAANKKYVDDGLAKKLDLSGGTVTGDIDMSAKKVTNLPLPTDPSDATTKDYVDTEIPKLIVLAPTEADAMRMSADASNRGKLFVWS